MVRLFIYDLNYLIVFNSIINLYYFGVNEPQDINYDYNHMLGITINEYLLS